MTDPTDFLLPILGLIILGGVIGITFWLAWVIFKMRYKEQLSADKVMRDVTPRLNVAPRNAYLLTVSRAPGGTWEITVNGARYASLEAVPDDAVRQDVVAGLKEAALFVRGYVQREQVTKSSPAPGMSPQPVGASLPRAGALPTLPVSAPDKRIPPVEKSATPAQAAPSPMNRLRTLVTGEPVLKRPSAAPTLMPVLNLAHEIGEILTEMQAANPAMAGRSIKLQDAPGGGVYFAIDGIIYSAVDEIPDGDVQALIRAATKEWERR